MSARENTQMFPVRSLQALSFETIVNVENDTLLKILPSSIEEFSWNQLLASKPPTPKHVYKFFERIKKLDVALKYLFKWKCLDIIDQYEDDYKTYFDACRKMKYFDNLNLTELTQQQTLEFVILLLILNKIDVNLDWLCDYYTIVKCKDKLSRCKFCSDQNLIPELENSYYCCAIEHEHTNDYNYHYAGFFNIVTDITNYCVNCFRPLFDDDCSYDPCNLYEL